MTMSPLYVGPFLHLRTVAAFEHLTNAQLRDLAYEAQEVVVPRGGPMIRQGAPGAAMYLVVDGFVDTGAESPVGPGGVIGFLDVLASAPAATGAVAQTDVVAFRVETDALREVCEQNFAVLGALLAHVAGRTTRDRRALMRSVAGRTAHGTTTTGPLDRVARILALHRSPAFPSRNLDALAELAGHLDEVRVAEGDELWRPGQDADGFYLICSGGVRVRGGAWQPGDLLGPGAVPGLVSTLADQPFEYEATAAEASVLLHVRREPFLDVIEDHFEMAYAILGRIARHLIESDSSGSASPVSE